MTADELIEQLLAACKECGFHGVQIVVPTPAVAPTAPNGRQTQPPQVFCPSCLSRPAVSKVFESIPNPRT